MNLLADECCTAGLIAALRDDGHDVTYVVEGMPGATDRDVLATAYEQERLLLTEDKDFGTLVYQLQYATHEILLLRFEEGDERKNECTLDVLNQHGEKLTGAFTVIQANSVRSRPLR